MFRPTRWTPSRLLIHGPRDFIAELDLLTGQRVYVTFVVTRPGSIIRVPRSAVKAIIEADGTLGELYAHEKTEELLAAVQRFTQTR